MLTTGELHTEDIKTKLASQYTHLVVVALQYAAPVLCLLFAVMTMKRKAGYSLGVCDRYEAMLAGWGVENSFKVNGTVWRTVNITHFSPDINDGLNSIWRNLKAYR
jgi:hypothetical protein